MHTYTHTKLTHAQIYTHAHAHTRTRTRTRTHTHTHTRTHLPRHPAVAVAVQYPDGTHVTHSHTTVTCHNYPERRARVVSAHLGPCVTCDTHAHDV